MKIHQRISNYISNQGFLLKKVAEKAEIEQKRFYRIINGTSQMSVDEFENICRKGLEIEPSYFFNKKFSEIEKSA